jgi:putative tricarboxylic transport membrane protein
MDVIHGIIGALQPALLMYCFLGSVLGTFVGVLPGLGPAAAMSILLPLVINLNEPAGSIIMFAALYYGAEYGSRISGILTNIPGHPTGIATTFDGFPMTKQGRAGEALWMSGMSAFVAGIVGVVMISIIGPRFATYALRFGPPEYFGLIFFSLTALVVLSGKSITKGLGVAVFGMVVAAIGPDPVSGGEFRLTFGLPQLARGFDLIPLAVGLFGIGEVLTGAEQGLSRIYAGKLGRMIPQASELKKGFLACLRGIALGYPLGILPGMNPAVASLAAYDLEKRVSKYPEKFGTGMIEGVAAPEAACNANAEAGFIPLFAFGIPTSPSPALILAVFTLYGLQPGPLLFINNRELIFTIIGSMYIGNLMLVILNLPLVGLWARISLIPYKYLAPVILAVCIIGAYSARNTMFDVWVAIAAGVAGYLIRKADWPIAPLLLGFMLGPMLELALSQSLNMGGTTVFFTRPISAGFLLATIAIVLLSGKLLRRVPQPVLHDEATG